MILVIGYDQDGDLKAVAAEHLYFGRDFWVNSEDTCSIAQPYRGKTHRRVIVGTVAGETAKTISITNLGNGVLQISAT